MARVFQLQPWNEGRDGQAEPQAGSRTGNRDGRHDRRPAYAFIGMEQASVIAIYDVTDPEHPEFCGIHMGRNIEEGKPGAQQASDLGPESLVFISAENAPDGKPLLAVAYEVSGTTTLYEIGTEENSTPAQVPQ